MSDSDGNRARDCYGDSVRYFNLAGPCIPGRHYMLPPEQRLPEARSLVEIGEYFIVHAPRQTGKTTTLSALAQELTAAGKHAALLFSCETAEVAEDDYGAAELQVLQSIRSAARLALPARLQPPGTWPDTVPGARISEALQQWALACPLPLVLFFDEIDALRGDSLRSILRQLRSGSQYRAHAFPFSVALCGLRDVRDYKAASGGDPLRLGTASPFNVAVESLRMRDFSADEAAALYKQHTEETGQEFAPEAIDRAFGYSQGQPWLVNALAREVIGKMGIEPPVPITAAHIDMAKERLILARRTHLDSLAARLAEERVHRIIEPLIAGDVVEADPAYNDDVSYARDLGLVKARRPIEIANPIYREVIVRVLGERAADSVTVDPRSFLLPDGRLDFGKLLEEFAAFWRQHGEILVKGEMYHEVAPQLVFLAFLQRVVNGGGFVDREYGVGRGRMDILVRKPWTDGDGKPALQQEAIELKVRRRGQPNPLREGLEQLDEYLSRMDLPSGILIIFDRRPTAVRKPPRPEISATSTPTGRPVTLLQA